MKRIQFICDQCQDPATLSHREFEHPSVAKYFCGQTPRSILVDVDEPPERCPYITEHAVCQDKP